MRLWSLLFLSLVASLRGEDFQGSTQPLAYEDGVIHYDTAIPTDAASRLATRLARGEAKLPWDAKFGYLPALLAELKIPIASQMLVFSKTSLQRQAISPENPRALYFSDDLYVGFIPGAERIEIAAVDPKLGSIFYTLAQAEDGPAELTREMDCLRCHGAQRSLGVPGPILRSIGTDARGELDSQTEVSEVDQCAPLTERWAGWYVTGQHGAQTHRGNLVGPKALARQKAEPNFLGNLADLHAVVDAGKYLRGSSDITAEMVLTHQAHMHNYITRLNFETQLMVSTYGHIRYLHNQVNAFLRYLLFTEETPLTAPIAGDPEFRRTFEAAGPRDHRGRSLRDFDFQKRKFRYPCSFLIYSEAFDHLPEVMRLHLLEKLYAILTGREPDPQFAALTAADRRAVLEILRETKPGLPDYWQAD